MQLGHSHSFDVAIAKKYGVNCAILYNHVIYWLRINASKGTNFIEGQTWMYETQQEMANFLEYLTFEEVKKAMVKLLDAGLLIKGNFNKNPFDKTAWYTTPDQNSIGFQKTLTKAPYSAIDNALERDGQRFKAPCIYDKKEQQEEQQQQQGAIAPAAASLKKPKAKAEEKIYPCLERIDIPDHEKAWLTKNYHEDDVIYAIAYATHPLTKIDTTLVQVIKWACSARPEMPLDPKARIEENKAMAERFDELRNDFSAVHVLSKHVEIVPHSGNAAVYIEYEAKDFEQQLANALKKFRFLK